MSQFKCCKICGSAEETDSLRCEGCGSCYEVHPLEQYIDMAVGLVENQDIREIASALAVRDSACALHVKSERLLSEPEDNATIRFLEKLSPVIDGSEYWIVEWRYPATQVSPASSWRPIEHTPFSTEDHARNYKQRDYYEYRISHLQTITTSK